MINQLLFVFLIVLGFAFFSYAQTKERSRHLKNLFITYVCVILALQSGLRSISVGSDTFRYYERFVTEGSQSWESIWSYFREVYVEGDGKDAGYLLVEKLFYSYISHNYTLYLLIVAAFVFYSWGSLLKRFCSSIDEVLLSTFTYLLLFYDFMSITGIRQTIAISCSILCYLALIDKKYVKFLLLGVAAFFIHKSAAIILIFPILKANKNHKLITVISVILFFFALVNRSFLVDLFRELAEHEEFSTRLPYKLMAFYFVVSFFIFRFIKKNENKSDHLKWRRLYNMYAPAFFCIPLLGWDSLFMREILYFSIYSTVFIPVIIDSRFEKKIVMMVYLSFCIIMFITQNSHYSFFWQQYLPSLF